MSRGRPFDARGATGSAGVLAAIFAGKASGIRIAESSRHGQERRPRQRTGTVKNEEPPSRRLAPAPGGGYTSRVKHDDAPAIKTPQQEARSLAQREANRLAREHGLPLPYPNIWDALDPTKIDPEDATPEAITRSYREFCKLCPPRKRKRHTL